MHTYVARDYQLEAIDAAFEQLASCMSTLIIMSTGTGKTEVYLKIVEGWLDRNPDQKVMMVAHREELITQPAERWRRNRDEWPAIEMGELRVGSDIPEMWAYSAKNKRFVIASVQTLNAGTRCSKCTAPCGQCDKGKIVVECRCQDEGGECDICKDGVTEKKRKCVACKGDGWISHTKECDACFEHFRRRMTKFQPEEFGLIIFDECDLAMATTWLRVLRWFRNRNPQVRLLGLTATPDRADEQALGKIFESVAYEYNLPKPILDGWLTPIEQIFVSVDELNLANVRTTAGDLNAGDLEREMIQEKVIHKVTTPLVEIACGMEQGTIDRLIASNTLDTLTDLCVKRSPTLVHCVDVAHAERTTEIINRYLPGSALCITGKTPKADRREGIDRFGRGDYQFLLSCGVFLRGTDLPNVTVVGMARPTGSRSLFSQMLGRGLRPLSGLVEWGVDAEERRALIAASAKPACICVDFVGNCGKHKLVTSLDILGGETIDPSLIEGIKRKAVTLNQPVDVMAELERARRQQEENQRVAREEATKRAEAEAKAKAKAAERRNGIVAGATYSTLKVNPFDVMDVMAQREPEYHKGRKPTQQMLDRLQKAKVPTPADLSYWDAHLLIEKLAERQKKGMCTFKQAEWLRNHGYNTELKFEAAARIIDSWAQNGWKKPEPKAQVAETL